MGSIEKLTAALEANTAIQEKVLAALTKGGAAAAASKPAAGAAAGAKPTATKPAASKKKTSVDDMAAAFGGYLGVKDKAEREVRKANVKAIVEYFGAAKATEIDADSFDEALGYLQQYIDGDTPEFAASEDGSGDDEALV